MTADDQPGTETDAVVITRVHLLESLVSNIGISRARADLCIQDLLGIMTRAFQRGDKVKVPRFGTFIVTPKKARNGRNPNTGEALLLPARRVLSFKPSPILRARVNGR